MKKLSALAALVASLSTPVGAVGIIVHEASPSRLDFTAESLADGIGGTVVGTDYIIDTFADLFADYVQVQVFWTPGSVTDVFNIHSPYTLADVSDFEGTQFLAVPTGLRFVYGDPLAPSPVPDAHSTMASLTFALGALTALVVRSRESRGTAR